MHKKHAKVNAQENTAEQLNTKNHANVNAYKKTVKVIALKHAKVNAPKKLLSL
jgi:hypothetical protein